MPTKFEDMIMQQYLDTKYGVADDFTEMGTEMAGGTEPEGATPMTLGEFATSAADVPAGLLKGAVQASIGLPGDIESIAYGVREIMNKGADESFLTAFVRGIQEGTVLPTTEDVTKWLDENLGKVVPEGSSERRTQAANIPETVGVLFGAGQTATTVAKAATRGAKKVGKKAAIASGVAAPAAAETENR